MKIFIDGGLNTINKGAELLIYAILQELERKNPQAEVFLPLYGIPEGSSYIKTTTNCKQRKIPIIIRLFKKIKGDKILRRIFRIPFSYTTDQYPIKGIDLVLDAGGFRFSDQQHRTDMDMKILTNYYKDLKKQRTNIFFLSQAFGPFETKNGIEQANLLKKYADCIIAREETSYHHLVNSGFDKTKILLYPDFTALVNGEFPVKYESLKNGIAIIPNLRMIDKGAILKNDYINCCLKIINICRETNKNVFFLNHEGKDDFNLCEEINTKLVEKLPIVSDLNALEVKGLISQCYFVFSSRFHGLVSALSSGVPCMATSWSHKYKMLFKDYDMEDCIFALSDSDILYKKLEQFLDINYNNSIRNHLKIKALNTKEKNREMWEKIWELLNADRF